MPKFLRQLIRSGQIYLDSHPNASSVKKFGNAYNMVFHDIFMKSYAEYQSLAGGGFSPIWQ